MGRPPLTEEQVRARVAAYCQRYHVSPGPGGLPPFPTGKRETRQHREWLTVYRVLQRAKARAAASVPTETPASGSCPICARLVAPEAAVAFERAGRRRSGARLHPRCADLVHLVQEAGPEAVARLSEWLWPRRGRASP